MMKCGLRPRSSWRSAALLCAFAFLPGCGSGTTAPVQSIEEFENRLEALRSADHIAGISAVITNGQQIVWSRGFGDADIAAAHRAEAATVFHLASLTKTFASTVILQLVEEGKVSLNDPVSKFGVIVPGGGAVLVRHLMSHTSEGVPGTRFAYNGDRFGLLDSVVSRGGGVPFSAALQQRIISRLALTRTAPNPRTPDFTVSGLDRQSFESNMARGYTYGGGNFTATPYPDYFGTAAGLTASALDVAAFSMAMDRDLFLLPATKALAFTPATSPSGEVFPYGLGWFSTTYQGVRIIWHYGLWTANSSLIIKVPDRGLSFVVLANTDGLSARYPLGDGKLESSPWARAFLDAFVIGNLKP